VRTYPGDVCIVELVNPDTGAIDFVVGDDPAEAWWALAERGADDI
jgi:hypothetical protein